MQLSETGLAVPGSDGVAGAEEDVVTMDGVKLQGLGGRAVAPGLVTQAYPGLDLLEHLHHCLLCVKVR